MGTPFSGRHGFSASRPIVVREDAPEPLRAGVVNIARNLGMSFSDIREIACGILNRFPDTNNFSEVPNVRDEVRDIITTCPWYRVFDVAEALARRLDRAGNGPAFQAAFNRLCEEEGVGWQMAGGDIVTRGGSEFESAIQSAAAALSASGRGTAARELEEARRDLSRRPDPDVTGCIQHSMAAIECLVRGVARSKETLGTLLKTGAIHVPKPLDVALEKLWGYASNTARHIQEGETPSRAEAELTLAVVAAIVAYLLPVSEPLL